MAAGYLQHLAGDRIEVLSAGSEPADQINPAAVEAMAEEGIDIAADSPRSSPTSRAGRPTSSITMGCGDACPFFPGKRYEDWELDDPAGQGIEAVRPIRDEIRGRVEALIAELASNPSPRRPARGGATRASIKAAHHDTAPDLQTPSSVRPGPGRSGRPTARLGRCAPTA